MKVIFKRDVGGVGQRGTVKEVSDGYALNFLIPNGMAEQATADKVAAHTKATKAEEAAQAAKEKEWAEAAARVDGATVQIAVNANESGHLYKALSTAEIVAEVKKIFGVEVPTNTIIINAPIKETGLHTISIKFGKSIAKMTLVLKA